MKVDPNSVLSPEELSPHLEESLRETAAERNDPGMTEILNQLDKLRAEGTDAILRLDLTNQRVLVVERTQDVAIG